MSSFEHISVKLDNITEDLKEIKEDLKETKSVVNMDLVDLKLKQQRCDSHWSLMGRFLSFGSIGTVLGSALVRLFPPHK